MNKKKLILFAASITLLLSLILHSAAYSFYRNSRFGLEIDGSLAGILYASKILAEKIDDLEQALARVDYDISRVNTDAIDGFDYAIISAQYDWGYGDMPISADVRLDYLERIEELRHLYAQGNEALAKAFADENKSKEISLLKNQLYLLSDTLTAFTERYHQLTSWEKYFVNWKDVHIQLSETVRIPASE